MHIGWLTLIVLLRPVDVLVCRGEGELAAAGLGRLPLHGILGRDGANFIPNDVLLRVVVAERERGADVLAAGGLHGGVESLRLPVDEAREENVGR